MGEVSEIIIAHGHANVQATHRSTIEFTKEGHLSRTGDCIIAVGADKAPADLSSEFRESLRNPTTKLTITIEADDVSERISAFGAGNLLLTHHSDMVVRKSRHLDSRTLAVGASKAAKDLSRELVEKLRNPSQTVKITLTASS